MKAKFGLKNLSTSSIQRINLQLNCGTKVRYMRKKSQSRDLLMKSNILLAELLTSQMSVSKSRSDLISGNVFPTDNNLAGVNEGKMQNRETSY